MVQETDRPASSGALSLHASASYLQNATRKAARAIEGVGIGVQALTGIGFVLGLGASASLAVHANLIGLLLFLLNRMAVVIAPRMANQTRVISILNLLLGLIALAAVPFGMVLADASHALAACFLILSLSIEGLAQHLVADKNPKGEFDAFAVLAAIGLCVACVMNAWFGLLSYAIGVVGFISAGRWVAALVGDPAS